VKVYEYQSELANKTYIDEAQKIDNSIRLQVINNSSIINVESSFRKSMGFAGYVAVCVQTCKTH
jgi:hypothetical protein